jgi:hypothetical protein
VLVLVSGAVLGSGVVLGNGVLVSGEVWVCVEKGGFAPTCKHCPSRYYAAMYYLPCAMYYTGG